MSAALPVQGCKGDRVFHSSSVRQNHTSATFPQHSSPFRGSLRRISGPLAAALLCALAFAGCRKPHQPDVVATINGHSIKRAELDRWYRSNSGDSERELSPVQANITRLDILRQLIDEEILQERAAKLNLVATDEEVDGKVGELKAPFTQEEFDKQLRAKNMTLDDLRRQIRRSLTSEKLMNRRSTRRSTSRTLTSRTITTRTRQSST